MESGLKRNIFARKWLNRHTGIVRVALGEDMVPLLAMPKLWQIAQTKNLK